jgi:hypothetical protein
MQLGRKAAPALALAIVLAVSAPARAADEAGPALQPTHYRDGHTRPRALAFNPDDGLLFVALSTSDEIAVVDPAVSGPRVLARRRVGRFPDAVVALPGGGALVACRFDPGLRRIERAGAGDWRVDVLATDLAGGARGLALAPDGRVVYVASPAAGGVEVVALGGGRRLQTMPTGLSPRTLRVIPAGRIPGQKTPLLLVSAFIDHVVSVHPIEADGRLRPAIQTIPTAAPVLDLVFVESGADRAPSLWLLTHEDRPVSRANGSVEGLDSGIIRLVAGGGERPFVDPGPGRRTFLNLGERPAPVIELAAAAAGVRVAGANVAIVGAGTDNLLLLDGAVDPSAARPVPVGENPSAVAALPGGRFVTADRLADTLTFLDGARASTLPIGEPERRTPAELGELLFYSRALVPHNVADGPLSLYTCAACHDDGHVDGRRHPAKRNRFFSMTESCRGLATTAPYLNLGDPETIDAFADNIVATHAQGAERDPKGFASYPVALQARDHRAVPRQLTLPPGEVRAALAAYMARIPPEPSPFVSAGRRRFAPAERRGLALFRADCSGCHQLVGNSALGNAIPAADLERRLLAGEVALTSPRRYTVGTPVLGAGGNNPPSLRGAWDAAPYFSDGSARTLDEVLRRTDPDAPAVHAPENATRPPAFSASERADLLAFLRAL